MAADADAADVMSPLDIPLTSPIPLLSSKSLQYLIRSRTQRRHLNALGPSRHCEVKRLQRLRRRRSSHGLRVNTSDDVLQRLQDMDEDFHVAKNMSALCICWSCQYLRHWGTSLQPYRCNYKACRIDFESFIDMYEHQLEVHGGLNPKTSRVVNDTFRQQRGTLAFPPATVYAAQQYMVPSRPPIPWKSISELDIEATTVRDRLWKYNPYCFDVPYRLFTTGYQLVKRNGWNETQRQFHIAMEHFYSGLKFPASSRGFHDGCPSIERGRNWLKSTDRENSHPLFPFGVNDKVVAEPEVVLIDTKHDQAMQEFYIELSDDSDDEIVALRSTSESKKRKKRAESGIKSKTHARVQANPRKNQQGFHVDRDEQEAEVVTDNDEENRYRNHKALHDDTSHDDAFIKSKEDDSDKHSEMESNLRPTFSRPADVSGSDSNRKNDDEDRQLMIASQGNFDKIVSASASESTSEDEAKLKAGNVTAFIGSDRETRSDRDCHSDESHNHYGKKHIREGILASEASSSTSDCEPKFKDEHDQYASDTESESEGVF